MRGGWGAVGDPGTKTHRHAPLLEAAEEIDKALCARLALCKIGRREWECERAPRAVARRRNNSSGPRRFREAKGKTCTPSPIRTLCGERGAERFHGRKTKGGKRVATRVAASAARARRKFARCEKNSTCTFSPFVAHSDPTPLAHNHPPHSRRPCPPPRPLTPGRPRRSPRPSMNRATCLRFSPRSTPTARSASTSLSRRSCAACTRCGCRASSTCPRSWRAAPG
jgi:hypothetical protein